MGKLVYKPGVEFGTTLTPAGARILDTLKHLAGLYTFDIMITSARDGEHSGPDDPHHTGEAFDLRTHDLTPPQANQLLIDLHNDLYLNPRRFYAFLEAPGTPNAHIHVQRRAGTIYTIYDYLSNS